MDRTLRPQGLPRLKRPGAPSTHSSPAHTCTARSTPVILPERGLHPGQTWSVEPPSPIGAGGRGVCHAGVLKDRPPASAVSKPTGTPLPLRGARESGRGLRAPFRDHTMGAVSPASSTDQTEVGGAARASFHRLGWGEVTEGQGGAPSRGLRLGWRICVGHTRPLEDSEAPQVLRMAGGTG